MHSILFVDVDKTVLSSLKGQFEELDFDLYFAQDGKQALEILPQKQIDMVISEMRMPKMNGHQFLKEVQRLYPRTIRIIMSKAEDEKASQKAVLDGAAKIFFLKPLELVQLLDVIPYLFEFQDMMASKNLLEVINSIEQLPSVTDVYIKISNLIEHDASIAEITAVIEKDPAVSAKILQLINSAFFNKKIGSLKQATAYLGLNTIKNLVLTTSIFNYAANNSTAHFNQLFSQQAVLTNKILEFEYKAFFGKRLPENYMTAGLLHDIGMILMQQHFSLKYETAFQECSRKQRPLFVLENQVFGVTHQAIGGYLLEWWGIPYPIIESSLCHHDPLSSTINRELVCAVHLADYYAWSLLGQQDLVKLDDRVFYAMGLDQEKCATLVNEAWDGWADSDLGLNLV